MYETIEKDLRRISDWLEAIGTANVDYRKVVINAALDLNWYKTIKDAADALESADKRIAELAKQAEHTDQVDAMILATNLKQTARITELEAETERLKASNEELRERQTYIDHWGDKWMTSGKDVLTAAYNHGFLDGEQAVRMDLRSVGKGEQE